MSSLTAATLIAILETATPQEKATIASLLTGADAVEKASVVLKKQVGRPRKEKPVFVLPPASVSPPLESAYRLNPFDIQKDICVGRVIPPGFSDKRWSIAVLAEAQCCGTPAADSDICVACQKKEETYLADPHPEKPKYRGWSGRVTEEPLAWQHFLGTKWAADKMVAGKLKWLGAGLLPAGGCGVSADSDTESASSASVSTTPSVRLSPDSRTVVSAVAELRVAAREAEKTRKEEEKKAKLEEKAIEKAAKAAEKEALKAAKMAAKEADKAAKAAEKEAEKAAKTAAKTAAKAKKE